MYSQLKVQLPNAPILVTRHRKGILVYPDGEIKELNSANAEQFVEAPVIQCYTRVTAAALNLSTPIRGYDVLELFAFVRPAEFCLPTISGLAAATSNKLPKNIHEDSEALIDIIKSLLNELSTQTSPQLKKTAALLDSVHWSWGASVMRALNINTEPQMSEITALHAWHALKLFPETIKPRVSNEEPILENESIIRLASMLSDESEERPSQTEYAVAITNVFSHQEYPDQPNLLVAEAGTGIGKTLAYLAPATLWAEKNNAAVWISTYTRNLQQQLDKETDKLYTDPTIKAKKVVIRKGRENYFCLLNYQEAVNQSHNNPNAIIALALISRWVLSTRSGDMLGDDLPSWLSDILGLSKVLALADRRGECIHSACTHYKKCFVEKAIRNAQQADIVVANHALVMVQAALGGLDDTNAPSRYIFDEGHHIFDAADNAFAAHLTINETADLRRWILGGEGNKRASRSRGIKKRISDVVELLGNDSEDLSIGIQNILKCALVLPAPGYKTRLLDNKFEGPSEDFFLQLRHHMYTNLVTDSPYNLELEILDLPVQLIIKAKKINVALSNLGNAIITVLHFLDLKIRDCKDPGDNYLKLRMESLHRTLHQKAALPLNAWNQMLETLEYQTPAEFIDWFCINRYDGKDVDIGLHRHWIDPTLPFAQTLITHAQGVGITSATLKDNSGEDSVDWEYAEKHTGISHFSHPPKRSALQSPFDYENVTRVYIVNDIKKTNIHDIANAYQNLFAAANGGALGLFTAISRLKKVHEMMQRGLENLNIPLYAQHVDPFPTNTLIDIFRSEEDSCLLGTDAVRDGIDVPGSALRLMVFDRVPWPRPSILHRARRNANEGSVYDDRITRSKLKQAFGRLIRSGNDKGVFVILDPMTPTRLLSSFPKHTPIKRLSLKEVVKETKIFLETEF